MRTVAILWVPDLRCTGGVYNGEYGHSPGLEGQVCQLQDWGWPETPGRLLWAARGRKTTAEQLGTSEMCIQGETSAASC